MRGPLPGCHAVSFANYCKLYFFLGRRHLESLGHVMICREGRFALSFLKKEGREQWVGRYLQQGLHDMRLSSLIVISCGVNREKVNNSLIHQFQNLQICTRNQSSLLDNRAAFQCRTADPPVPFPIFHNSLSRQQDEAAPTRDPPQSN
jgi:hypothetical protein